MILDVKGHRFMILLFIRERFGMQTFIAIDISIDDNFFCLIEVHNIEAIYERMQTMYCKRVDAVLNYSPAQIRNKVLSHSTT